MPVIFIVIWALLGLGGLAVFRGDSVSVSFKRRAWPAYILLTSAVFVVFGIFLDKVPITLPAVLIITIGVSIIAWLNISRAKFCSNCGRLNHSGLGASDKFCRRCGHSLAGPASNPNSN